MAVVGDAPGDEECTKRKVFEGRSGYVLDVALKEAGVPKEEVLLATVVRCMPYRGKDKRKFREPTREEMRFCGERFLEPTLRRVQPNVIVALGGKAMEYFTKGALMGDVNVWRGKVVDVDGSDTHAEEVPF